MPEPDIVNVVAELPNEQALEAVQLLAGETLGTTPDNRLREAIAQTTDMDSTAVEQILDNAPAQDVAALARVVLIAHAEYRSRKEVETAIAQTGQKALFLEITALCLLALGIMHLMYTKGRSETSTKTSIVVEPSGKVTITTETQTKYYSVGDTLAPLLGEFLQMIQP